MTRINKFLAEQGYASRREADQLIRDGHVLVNGQLAQLGQTVQEGDRVEVRGDDREFVYLAYHKPRGLATEEIKPPRPDLYPIGRLDQESEGLLIFTNDGRLTTKLIGPDSHTEKEYVVTTDKKVDGLDLKRLSVGMEIEGERTKAAQAIRINDTVFRLILTEGKKHQIRRMCAGLGYQVKVLKRVRIGSVHLGQLAPGAFRPLETSEFRNEAER